MTTAIGFDEAGNTGPDLLNPDQPLYVLASVRLTDEEAACVLESPQRERHFAKDRTSRAGRDRIVRSLTSPLLTKDTVRYTVIHKDFCTTAKMIDLLVEPVLKAAGIDIYAEGMHLGAANLLHLALSTFDPHAFREMQSAFVGMCRQRTQAEVERFYVSADTFNEAVRSALREDDPLMGSILLSRPFAADLFIGPRPDRGAPSDLDPAVTCVIALLHDWASAFAPVTVEHDESKEVKRSLEVVQRLWRAGADEITLTLWNGEQLTYPLPVVDFDFASSSASPRVQVADLVASGAALVHAGALGKPETGLSRAIGEVSWDYWRSNASIWPSVDDITPDRSQTTAPTAFSADATAQWLQ